MNVVDKYIIFACKSDCVSFHKIKNTVKNVYLLMGKKLESCSVPVQTKEVLAIDKSRSIYANIICDITFFISSMVCNIVP